MKFHIWIILLMKWQAIVLNAQSEFIQQYEYHDAPYLSFGNMLVVSPDTIIVSGYTQNVTGDNRQGIYLAKADTLGHILFDTVITIEDDIFIHEAQYGIIRTSDGGYAIVGQYLYRNNGVLIKTDNNFRIEFVKEFEENASEILNIRNEEIIELAGHYYIMSRKYHADDALEHSHLMKVTLTGELVWDRSWADEGWWALFHMEKHQTQDVVMLYGIKSKAHLPNPPPDSSFRWIAFLDTSGVVIHEYTMLRLPGDRIDLYTAFIDDDEIYITGGYTQALGQIILSEPYLARVNQSLDVQCEYVHSPKREGLDYVGFRSINKCIDENIVTPLVYITPYNDGAVSPNILMKLTPGGEKVWERKDSILWNPVQGVVNIPNKTVVLPSGSILTCGTGYKFNNEGTSYQLVGYFIKVNNNGCLNGDCPEILVAVDDSNYPDQIFLSIYPSPSEGLYSIQSERMIESIAVTSIDGKIILEKKVQAQEATFDLSFELAGVFILTVKGKEFKVSKTIVKQ